MGCVLSVGQLWTWNTNGTVGPLSLTSSGTCVNAAQDGLKMVACDVATDQAYTFPPSAPPTKCHGCQVDCCVVPRKFEMPCQQQGVTPTTDKLAKPIKGCEGGMVMWSGDGWQQAPD